MALARASLACIVFGVLCQASRTTDEQRARAWLLAHDNPDEAGMNELRATDPTAFGIVQALLAKQKLGLLDPNHPSASFTKAAPKEHKSFAEAAAEAGIANDAPVHAEAESSVQQPYPDVADASPYPEVSHHSHDPWNFKVASHDDDELVSSVLGQVAALKSGEATPTADTSSYQDGGSSRSLLSSSHAVRSGGDLSSGSIAALSNAFGKRAPAPPSLDWGNRYAATSNSAEPSTVMQKPQAAMSQANSNVYSPSPRQYMANSHAYAPPRRVAAIVERRRTPVTDVNPYLPPAPFKVSPISQAPAYTFHASRRAPVAVERPQPAMSQENSYLKGIDFGAKYASRPAPVEKPQPAMDQENSYLKGIDFSSELADAHAHQIKTVYHPLNVAPQASMSQENSYLKGIDFSSELAAAQHSEARQAMRATPVSIEKPKLQLAPVPQETLDSSADAPDGSFLKGFNFNDEMKEVGIKQAVAPLKTAVNGYLNDINFNAANTEVAAPASPQPRPQRQAVPAQENPYAQEIKFNAQALQAPQAAVAEKNLEESDFHKLAAEYRQELPPPPAPRQSVDLGSAFSKDLAEAKSNGWRRALQATDWGKDKPRMSMASVASKADQKDDDDFDLETPGMITNHISAWLDKR